ncbi:MULTISPECIES: PAS domain-containing protein [unclassified Symbiopectobacterium]|uniref:PAS domain-containing protein n=1 Tax=unclassified Symbiopectobacterium TaxID=2794573 RepID=UPI0022264B91|nr:MULTISPECIES: PAS domain-containing protein [unclassified Symbiopectobacterium]MCW2473014.1 PAS domain-containing protein [Candidatus Symbiopectobacterium sp. NZEC151]MCW2482493.1 PAS domain-containing protein [Candidatus Symbiopectobacterium sp. NZEC135]MCW2488609.1 PAS domain-containing protein [Candidatus Symbiopectobacterium sp. NZEC127]
MNSNMQENIILPNMLITLLDQHNDAYFIKGMDSRFIYANLSVAKKVGVHSPSDLIDKTEDNIQSRLTEDLSIVKEWQWQDNYVITSRRKLVTLEVNPKAVDCPYIVRKFPFYNENNQCIGVLTNCRTLETFSPSEFINGQRPGSFLLTKPNDFFTENECEIIFLNLQGRTSESIANRLSCSISFVEIVLQKIYLRANVTHFDDFTAFCHHRNYHRYLPKRFVESNSILFDDNINSVV